LTRDPKYDVLFEPIQLGPKTMPNRFYQVPHCIGAGSDAPGMQAELRRVKAEGGWGAVYTEYVSIAPEDDVLPFVLGTIWDDDDVANLALMCDAVHEHDALAGIELGYGGAHSPNRQSRLVPRAPSQHAAEAQHGWLTYTSAAASSDEVREMQQLHVDGAIRAREAGFDIIGIYGGHGQGPMQFLSPYFNKRTDEYGGSFENRSRFWRELLDRVKQAVGDDCAIACRLAVDDLRPVNGVSIDETMKLVELCDHLVDVWDLTIGEQEWGEDLGTSRFYSEDHERDWQRVVREHTSKPLVGVGRYTSPDLMASIVRSGQLDIIGAARPSIADPFLPRKIHEGRLDDIRECIGCNACVARWDAFSPIVCTQNATMGEEYRRGWHPERFTRAANAENDVLVIGAGPAGMECARVLGERGMRRIHLVDMADEIGGSVRWISQLPGLGEWRRVINYRQIQLDKRKSVDIILRNELGVDEVLNYGAEFVVVATGSSFAPDGDNYITREAIPGVEASEAHCLTPEQIMRDGKAVPGDHAVVFDADGYVAGIGLAERLRREGKSVTYVTPFGSVGAYTMYTGEYPIVARRFHELGIEVRTETLVTGVAPGAVTVEYLYEEGALRHFPDAEGKVRESHSQPVTLAADAIVVVGTRRSDDKLFHALNARKDEWKGYGIANIFRVGDCVAPRQIADVVFDGHRLAREIDEPNPHVPKPYVRERRLVERQSSAA
jgi:dimethylamine/trimethylamine dehydrogenase